jgi:hypothetical protein
MKDFFDDIRSAVTSGSAPAVETPEQPKQQPEPPAADFFSEIRAVVAPSAPVPKSSAVRRYAGDTAIGLGKGVLGFGDALIGLADIPTLGKAGKWAASTEWLDFAGAQDILDTMLSPEQQADNKAVEDAAGFMGKVGAMLENPSTIFQGVLESAPSMLGGAGAARMLIKRGVPAVIAASVGEGVVAAGSSVEGIRQRTEDGELTAGQTAIGVASGVATSLLGIAGGKFAKRLGIEDIDVLLANGSSYGAKKNVITRVLEGMIAEGALEELPQSMQEQMAQNWATGRPLTEGVADAAAQGLVTGAAMGGAANLRAQRRMDLRTWAQENPEQAAKIAEMENPSRKDWDKTDLPRMNAKERADFAAEIRAITEEQPAEPAATPSTTAETPTTTVEVGTPPEPPTLDDLKSFAASIADLSLSDEDHSSIMEVYARDPDQAAAAVAEYRKGLEDQPVDDMTPEERAMLASLEESQREPDQPVPEAIVEDAPPVEESQKPPEESLSAPQESRAPVLTDEEQAMQDQLDLEAEAAQAEGAKPLTEEVNTIPPVSDATAARIEAAKAARNAVPPPVVPKKGPLTPEEKAKRKLAQKKLYNEEEGGKSFRTNLYNAIMERGGISHYKPRDSDRSGKRHLQEEVSRISYVVRKTAKKSLDQMLGSLQEDNVIPQDWTVNDLWEALVWGRKKPNREDTRVRNNAYYDDLDKDGKALVEQHTKEGKLLQPGQRVFRNDTGDADDAVYEVLYHEAPDADDLGRGGLTYAIIPVGGGDAVYVSDYALDKEGADARDTSPGNGNQKGESEVDKAPVRGNGNEGMERGAAAEAQGASAPEDLTLAGQTPDDIRAEAAAKADRDAKKAKKQALTDRAAKPLRGGVVDTTGDLLDQQASDIPLLVTPTPKPKTKEPLRGVGAAAAASQSATPMEFTEGTGTKNAYTKEMQERLGWASLTPMDRITDQESLDKAMVEINKNANYGSELVLRMQIEPYVPTAVERMALLHEAVVREQAMNSARARLNQVIERGATGAQIEAAKKQAEVADDALYALYNAVQVGSNEWGRAGHAMQRMMDDQFSLVSMVGAVRAQQGGKPLSKQTQAAIEDLNARLTASQKAIEEEKAKAAADKKAKDEEIARAWAAARYAEFYSEIHAEESKGTTRGDAMRAKAKDMRESAMAELRAMGGQVSANPFADPKRIAVLAKLGASYILENVAKLSDWIDAIRPVVKEMFGHDATDDELGKVYAESQGLARDAKAQAGAPRAGGKTQTPGEPSKEPKKRRGPRDDPNDSPAQKLNKEIKRLYLAEAEAGVKDIAEATRNVHAILGEAEGLTPEQVRDAFSDYGQVIKPKADEVSKMQAAWRSEAQKLAAIEDVLAKLMPLSTGRLRSPPVQKVRELTKKLHKLMKEAGSSLAMRNADQQPLASPLKAIKTRLTNQIQDLNKALVTKTKMVNNKAKPEYDAEATALKEKRDALRQQYEEMFPEEKTTPDDRLGLAKKSVQDRMNAIREQIKEKERKPKGEGPVRADQELTRMREEEAMLRGLMDKYLPETDKYAEGKKAKAIEGRLMADILTIQGKINALQKNGGKNPDPKSTAKPIENDAIIKLKAEKAARNAILNALRPPRMMTDEQRMEVAIKAAERSLADWEQRVKDARSGKFTKDAPKGMPANARLDAVKKQRDAAKAEFDRLNDLAHPKLSPEAIAVKARMARISAASLEMHRRMTNGDFSTKDRTEIDLSAYPAALRAIAAHEENKKEFLRLKEEARKANRTWTQVLGEAAMDTAHTSKNYLSAVDISAPGRQGWLLGLAHPIVFFRNFLPMVKSLSREQSLVIQARFREKPNYKNGTYTRAGLAVSPDDGTGNFTAVEDSHRLDLVRKVPLLGSTLGRAVEASNRAYGTYLNLIRAEVFDMLVANNPSDMSAVRLQAIAAGVNELSGRGDVGRHADTLAIPFWAPRFMKSAFDVFLLKPIHGKGLGGLGSVETTAETRRLFKIQYARMMGSLAVIYSLALMFKGGDDDEDKIDWDLRSSKFGAIRFGNQYWSPLGYFRPVMTMVAQLVAGQRKTAGGDIVNLREDYFPFATDAERKKGKRFGDSFADPFLSFMQSKLHPAVSALWSAPAVSGVKFGGRKQTWLGVLADLWTPLSIQQMVQNYEIDDFDAATVGNILNILGSDVKPDYKNPRVMRSQMEPEEYGKRVGTMLYEATGPLATEKDRDAVAPHISDMPPEVRMKLLVDAYKSRRSAKHKNDPINMTASNGKLTAFGERANRLGAITAK